MSKKDYVIYINIIKDLYKLKYEVTLNPPERSLIEWAKLAGIISFKEYFDMKQILHLESVPMNPDDL